MSDMDYNAILKKAFDEYAKLLRDRENLEFQIARQFQFIRATINMLPDEERADYERAITNLTVESVGLTEAIRRILQAAPGRWHTATDVRDKLVASQFDFTAYKANPLASVHAVLKRLKSTEFENTTVDGVMAWRWRVQAGSRRLLRRRVGTLTLPPIDGIVPRMGLADALNKK